MCAPQFKPPISLRLAFPCDPFPMRFPSFLAALLLCGGVVHCAEPAPCQTVCLTQLWEVYDYDYDYEDDYGGYAEIVVRAWTVEVKHDLPGGMTGWTYVGFIQLARILRYDSDEEYTEAWWSASSGKSGSEKTTEDAMRRILESRGPVGEIEVRWR